jgi:hypothetical protein
MAGAIVAGTAFLTGCASVDVAKTFNDQHLTIEHTNAVAHLNGDCWGIYLLSIVPLVTGDTSPTGSTMAFGQDNCTVDAVTGMVTRKSKELGATHTLDLSSRRDSTWIAPLLLFLYKDTQVSGNAVN